MKNSKSKKRQEKLVVQNIIVKTPQRKLWDVGTWRSALRSADMGRTSTLYDLFDDILLDGILGDAVQKRVDAVTNSELTFQNAKGEEVTEVTDLMDTLAWETLLSEIIKTKIYGRAAIEFDFTKDFEIHTIPAKHIDLTNKQILIDPSDDKGIPYESDNMLLVIGKERDFGLLLKATPYAIYKRGGFGDWSQWIELFGMPQRVGKYNTYDPQSRRLLEDAFKVAGSAPWMVVPKETDIETKESNSGNGASFNEFREACNEEMLITILGQTMTTVQGEKGARSLGEVHKEVEEGKNKADLRFVERVLNQKLIPMLQARGFKVEGGRFTFPQSAAQLEVNELVQLSEIIEIPASYVHQKYAIPIAKQGDKIAQRRIPYQSEDAEFEEKIEEAEEVKNNDNRFTSWLKSFFVKAPMKQSGALNGKVHMNLKDDTTLEKQLIKRVASGDANYFDKDLFYYILNDLLKAIQTPFKESINNTDIGYNFADDAFAISLEQNIFHFSAAKTLSEIQELNKLFRESSSFEDFSKEAIKVCNNFNKTWQKTEYQTAVLTAESASNYQRLQKKKKLYPYWKYVTAGDDRVRETHQQLDGIILNAEDTRWDKIFPPNGWKCRCRVEPVMAHNVSKEWLNESARIVDEYLGTTEWRMVEQQHWDSNRGKNAEVFNKNQMYIRKFPQMAAKYMDKISPAGWGAESSFKKLIGNKEAKKLEKYEGTADEYWDKNKINIDGKEMLAVVDYQDRTWYMKKADYHFHTSDTKKSRGFRVKYLSCINEVMKNPDEVWLGNEFKDRDNSEVRLNNWILIKYYNGIGIACVCKLDKGKMIFKSWYEVRNSKIRKGILIKK